MRTTKCKEVGCKYKFNPEASKQGYCQVHYSQYRSEIRHFRMADALKPRPAIIKGDVAYIPIGIDAKDGYTLVDKSYAYLADEYKFYLNSSGYPITTIDHKPMRIHHLVMGNPGKGKQVDHINRNRLDNRTANLRVVSSAENVHNSTRANGISGYRGVTKSSHSDTWEARIAYKGCRIHLGVFKTKEEAAAARDIATKKYHGKYADLNLG